MPIAITTSEEDILPAQPDEFWTPRITAALRRRFSLLGIRNPSVSRRDAGTSCECLKARHVAYD